MDDQRGGEEVETLAGLAVITGPRSLHTCKYMRTTPTPLSNGSGCTWHSGSFRKNAAVFAKINQCIHMGL